MQIGAMGVEPRLGAILAGAETLNEAPEPRGMVHLDQMGHFMRGEVIEHMARRQNEPP